MRTKGKNIKKGIEIWMINDKEYYLKQNAKSFYIHSNL